MVRVLLTADRRAPEGLKPGPRVRPHRPEVFLSESYVDAVRRAGGLPLLAPPGPASAEILLGAVDAVVLTGGHFDIHPRHYGQEVSARLDRVEEDRTLLELALARACMDRGIPVLGICGGMQLLAVATGGSLVQDLAGPPGTLEHEQATDPVEASHEVRCEGPLRALLGDTVAANSTHHQAVDHPGSFVPCAWASDGVLEGMAHPSHPFAVAVQWHPELQGDDRLYEALVAAARVATAG